MTEVAEDLILEGEALQQEGPCIEEGVGRVIVPSKGKLFADDGSVNVAIIRPCMSRGKRLRGLPPIYEPAMLGRNASVFEDWHMWMGHMSVPLKEALEDLEEKLQEQLQEAVTARRLFSELGGRVTKTWFDPTFRGKDDDSFGYQPGATMGRVIPYPAAKQILEADPDGLHVSIAAWPTSARVASPSWDASARGMAVEGFRSSPRGSVDWVLRGGAGGRPVPGKLTEAEALAVSVVETLYDPAREDKNTMPELKTMTLEQLRESLRKDNPDLAKELGIEEAQVPTPSPQPGETYSADDVQRMINEAVNGVKVEFTTKLEEQEAALTETVDETVAEERLAARHEGIAQGLIKKSGLPGRWQEDLLRRYSVLPSGPSVALLTEEETDDEGKTLSPTDVLKARVAEDIQHARELIEEVGGRPVVNGLGGGKIREAAGGGKPKTNTAFREFLVEGDPELRGKKPEEIQEHIQTMVQEGVA